MSENLMKKEKQEKLNLWDKICKYTPQIAVFLPVVSFVAGGGFKLAWFLYKSGYYGYYNIEVKNILANDEIDIYKWICFGIATIFYFCYSILSVRRIISNKINILFWGVILNYIISLFFCIIVLKEITLVSFVTALILIPCNWVMIFSLGFCLAHNMQEDLINKNKIKKKKKVKRVLIKLKNKYKNTNTKQKREWVDRDYKVLGIILITASLILGGFFTYEEGVKTAKDKNSYGIVKIENISYAVIDVDEKEMVLQKCNIKNNEIVLFVKTYLKTDKNDKIINYINFEKGNIHRNYKAEQE